MPIDGFNRDGDDGCRVARERGCARGRKAAGLVFARARGLARSVVGLECSSLDAHRRARFKIREAGVGVGTWDQGPRAARLGLLELQGLGGCSVLLVIVILFRHRVFDIGAFYGGGHESIFSARVRRHGHYGLLPNMSSRRPGTEQPRGLLGAEIRSERDGQTHLMLGRHAKSDRSGFSKPASYKCSE